MISEQKRLQLKQKMQELGILEKDLEESFVTGSGKGGQKLQKTASCVMLHHLPTGLKFKCQKARNREDNRFFARRLLCERYEAEVLGIKTQKDLALKKARKQKKRRARRRKENLTQVS